MNTDNFNKGLKKLLTLDSIRLTKIGILCQHILLYGFFTFIIGLILNDIMPDYDKSKNKINILIEVLIHLIILSFLIYYLRIIVMMFPFIFKINNFDSNKIDLSILYSEIVIIVIMVIATQMKLIKKINFLFKSLNKEDLGVEDNNLTIRDEKYLNKKDQPDNQKPNIEKFIISNDLNHNKVEKKKENENNFQTLISKIKSNIQALDSNSNLKFSSLDSQYNQPINQNYQNIFLGQSSNIKENFSNLNHSYLNTDNKTEYFDSLNSINSGNLNYKHFPSSSNQNDNLNKQDRNFDNQLSDRFINTYSSKQDRDLVSFKNNYDNISNNNNSDNNIITQNNPSSNLNDFKQVYFKDKKKNHIEDYFELNKGNTNPNDYDSKVISLEKSNNSPLQAPSYDTLLRDIHIN